MWFSVLGLIAGRSLPPRKLILRQNLAPGDEIVLTGAVRDLHLCHPGRFVTDVRTRCPDFWRYNPYLTPLNEQDPEVEVIHCRCPLIRHSNAKPYHYLHAYPAFLSERLGLPIQPTAFKGDFHLSASERAAPAQVFLWSGRKIPFWLLVAGGKYDLTIKWWSWRRFQQVVDHFRNRILFVQVGAEDHFHPQLRGVLDLRAQTDPRQLAQLMYHAHGVLCPVTFMMHLAAAVECRPDLAPSRPCVVVAGGREPYQWEAYPQHQFIHTIGALDCCRQGGCWRSRTEPLFDGEVWDQPQQLCIDVTDHLPRCMHLISAADVIRRIQLYFDGGITRFLTAREAKAAQQGIARRQAAMRAELEEQGRSVDDAI
jgi:ADP-heptose:LPS heptosyltransferase